MVKRKPNTTVHKPENDNLPNLLRRHCLHHRGAKSLQMSDRFRQRSGGLPLCRLCAGLGGKCIVCACVCVCYVVLCYVMLCYVMLCYVMLCYVVLCCVVCVYVWLCVCGCVCMCCVVLCCVVLCVEVLKQIYTRATTQVESLLKQQLFNTTQHNTTHTHTTTHTQHNIT